MKTYLYVMLALTLIVPATSSAFTVTYLDTLRYETEDDFWDFNGISITLTDPWMAFDSDWGVGPKYHFKDAETGDSVTVLYLFPDGQESFTRLEYDADTDCWLNQHSGGWCGDPDNPRLHTNDWLHATLIADRPLGTWTQELYVNDSFYWSTTFEVVGYDIELISGDGQFGLPGITAPVPLQVMLIDFDGFSPLIGQAVEFELIEQPKGPKNSGLWSIESGGEPVERLTVSTDAGGIATAWFDFGNKAGEYVVEASSPVVKNRKITFHLYALGDDDDMDADKNLGPGDGQCPSTLAGNPVNIATGNKYQRELDFAGAGEFPLELARHYNSNPAPSGGSQRGKAQPPNDISGSFGNNWRGSYDRSIELVEEGRGRNAVRLALVRREDGRTLRFTEQANGSWLPDADVGERLVQTAGGWRYLRMDDLAEIYAPDGRLIAIEDRAGRRQTLSFDAQGRLIRVEDPSGRALDISHDGAGRVARVTDPAGGTIDYQYDGLGNLASVIRQDGSDRRYLYENADFPRALTGIVDERGLRIATWTYDAAGRVVSGAGPDGANSQLYTYHADGTVTVTGPLGNEQASEITVVQGVARVSATTEGACVSCGCAASYFYDIAGRKLGEVDRNGNPTWYVRDARGREISRLEGQASEARRRNTRTWSDDHNQLLSVQRGRQLVRNLHDERGQPTSRIVRDILTGRERTTGFEYYDESSNPALAGLLKRVVEPSQAETLYEYYESDDPSGQHRAGDLMRVTNAAGQVTEFVSYDAAGRLTRVLDPNGVETIFEYHPRGWLVSTTTAGATTSYEYEPTGEISRINRPGGGFLAFEYDGAGRLVALENETGERIEYVLDAAGNRLSERIIDISGALRFQLDQVFDQLGRMTARISGEGAETLLAHDPNGNLVEEVDPLDRVTAHAYDPLNRLVESLDALSGKTGMDYDERDNLVAMTDPAGLTTRYTFDALDDLVELDSPDTGVTVYEYDAAGRRIAQVDARGVRAGFEYDVLNRMIAIRHPSDPGLDVILEYDSLQPECEIGERFPVGRLTRMIDASGETRYCFDARGNLARKVQLITGTTLVTSYRYTIADAIEAKTYPSGKTVHYQRDASGRVTGIELEEIDGTFTSLVSQATWLPFGPLSGLIHGDGLQLDYIHDLDYRITGIVAAGRPELDLFIGRDGIGNIISIGVEDAIEAYLYDDLDRLSGVSRIDPPPMMLTLDYEYDGVGNRMSRTVFPDQETVEEDHYVYGPGSHRLVGINGDSRAYDESGNTLTGAGLAGDLIYDARSRLAAVSHGPDAMSIYQYNGAGERVWKQPAGDIEATRFVYGGAGRLMGEYRDGEFQEYVWLENRPVAVLRPDGVYYIQSDHLGTPRRVIEPGAGTVRWHWPLAGNPFGELLPDEDPEATGSAFELNLRFPGQYHDAETGLHYNVFRDYESGTGRYVQSDPIGLEGGVNTYTYAYANPLRLIDHLGLSPDFEDSFSGLPGSPSPDLDFLCRVIGGCDDDAFAKALKREAACAMKCLSTFLGGEAAGVGVSEAFPLTLRDVARGVATITSGAGIAMLLVCIEKQCDDDDCP